MTIISSPPVLTAFQSAVHDLSLQGKSTKALNRKVQELAASIARDATVSYFTGLSSDDLDKSIRQIEDIETRFLLILKKGGFHRWFGKSKTKQAIESAMNTLQKNAQMGTFYRERQRLLDRTKVFSTKACQIGEKVEISVVHSILSELADSRFANDSELIFLILERILHAKNIKMGNKDIAEIVIAHKDSIQFQEVLTKVQTASLGLILCQNFAAEEPNRAAKLLKLKDSLAFFCKDREFFKFAERKTSLLEQTEQVFIDRGICYGYAFAKTAAHLIDAEMSEEELLLPGKAFQRSYMLYHQLYPDILNEKEVIDQVLAHPERFPTLLAWAAEYFGDERIVEKCVSERKKKQLRLFIQNVITRTDGLYRYKKSVNQRNTDALLGEFKSKILSGTRISAKEKDRVIENFRKYTSEFHSLLDQRKKLVEEIRSLNTSRMLNSPPERILKNLNMERIIILDKEPFSNFIPQFEDLRNIKGEFIVRINSAKEGHALQLSLSDTFSFSDINDTSHLRVREFKTFEDMLFALRNYLELNYPHMVTFWLEQFSLQRAS